jgi:RNase P subunit RPR2
VADPKSAVRNVARERIEILYELSRDEFKKDKALSKNYISTLIKISQHHKVRLDPKMKAMICKHCKLPLIEGENAQIRIIASQKRKIYRCKICGHTNTLKFR